MIYYHKYMKFENVFEAEYKIQELIKNDNNCSAHFEYEKMSDNTYELACTTFNPIHKKYFLLHKCRETTKLAAVNEMYNHIFNLKTSLDKKDSPYLLYTIEWYCPEANKSITSTFYGDSIEQVLLKFNYGKKNKLTIYSMKLNPTC